MGKVHKFRKRPKNEGQFRGVRPALSLSSKRRPKRRWYWDYRQAMLVTLGVSAGGLLAASMLGPTVGGAPEHILECPSVNVLDGDTFDCGVTRIRLEGIDAPELKGHCRPGRTCAPGDPQASTANLVRLTEWRTIRCTTTDTDVYGRTVARCTAGEMDLSCAQIESGNAIRRYALIKC